MKPGKTIRPESPVDDIMTKAFTTSLFHVPDPILTEGHRLPPVPTVLAPIKTARVPEGVTINYSGDVPLETIYRK